MQALHDGCDIVGGSIDERGGWLLRPGYRDMMQQIKGGKVDRVYICRMRQISGKERHLYSFFKRLMQRGVQVTATEYSLRDRVNMFRLARRIEALCDPKGVAAAVVIFRGRRTVPMAQYEQARHLVYQTPTC